MNPPNVLTISRFFIAALMMAMLFVSWPFARTVALISFIIAAITDALDGHLARKVYGVTPIGSLLDPLADKVLVCAAFVSLVELQVVPAWIVVLILTREFLVTGLRVLAGNKGNLISAGPWGKHKTIWQMIVIGVLLLGLALQDDWLPRAAPGVLPDFGVWFHALAYVASVGVALITTVSGVIYFHQHRALVAEQF